MAGLGWAIPLNLSAFFQKPKGFKLAVGGGAGGFSSQTQLPHQGAGGGRRHSDPWGRWENRSQGEPGSRQEPRGS